MSEPARPRTLVVVAGTATEVGKTWVAARLAAALRARGWRVAARKPAQSFAPDELGAHRRGAARRRDRRGAGDRCARAPAGTRRRWRRRWPPTRSAGPRSRSPISRASSPSRGRGAALDLALVELAGGPRSPIARDGDGVELTHALAPELVLLVADAGLGTINAARLVGGRLRDRRALAPSEPLRRDERSPPPQSRLARASAAGLALSTDLDALVAGHRGAPPGLLPPLRPRTHRLQRLVRTPPRPPALLPPLRPQARRPGSPPPPPRPLPRPRPRPH